MAGDCSVLHLKLLGLVRFLENRQKSWQKKPKKPTHQEEQHPTPAVGPLQPPAQRPALPLHYREIFLTCFFPTKICLSSCPSLLNYETLWQTKPMPEDALGAGRRGKPPLQTQVSAPAARAQEPGSAARSSATRT